MKIIAALISMVFVLRAGAQEAASRQVGIQEVVSGQAGAQETVPRHFRPGRVVLTDSSCLTGFVRDYIQSNASVVFFDGKTGARRSYTGAQLLAVDIDTTRYVCLKGDFFRVLTTGDLWFVRKSSNAASRPAYNGTEPIMVNGTEGRLNDFFSYDPVAHTLKLMK